MRPRRSKSDLIRAYAAKHPKAGPTAVAVALTTQGVAVTRLTSHRL